MPSGAETEPNGAQVHGAAASPVAIETDLENAQMRSSSIWWLRLLDSRLR